MFPIFMMQQVFSFETEDNRTVAYSFESTVISYSEYYSQFICLQITLTIDFADKHDKYRFNFLNYNLHSLS